MGEIWIILWSIYLFQFGYLFGRAFQRWCTTMDQAETMPNSLRWVSEKDAHDIYFDTTVLALFWPAVIVYHWSWGRWNR